MAVFRIEKTRDYTVMANHHLRNTALSLKAKGLLSLMLSLPEDWDYTTYTCSRCGDTYKGDYTDAAGHKPGDWIIDQEPTTDSEGSKHKECEVCGETLETEEIEKIYNQATTDTHGEAVVGGYLVIVTDTDTKNPVANAFVAPHADHTLSVRLPSGRLLDYTDQTTITVLLTKDKSAVANMFIAVTDRQDNYCEDSTDANGQITVPDTTGKTNEDGNATVGWEDEDGDRWTITVKVEDHETGRPIEDAEVSIGKGGNITVTLPDGTDTMIFWRQPMGIRHLCKMQKLG